MKKKTNCMINVALFVCFASDFDLSAYFDFYDLSEKMAKYKCRRPPVSYIFNRHYVILRTKTAKSHTTRYVSQSHWGGFDTVNGFRKSHACHGILEITAKLEMVRFAQFVYCRRENNRQTRCTVTVVIGMNSFIRYACTCESIKALMDCHIIVWKATK